MNTTRKKDLKKHLKCACKDGSTIIGIREPILKSFVLDKPLAIKFISEPETIH